jgi:glycosyltransferase involved in cell wall biosynthesis
MSFGGGIERPVLFVTGHVTADRVGAFAALHKREGIELALFGGRVKHGPTGIAQAAPAELPFPSKRASERATGRLAASGRYRAVVCSTGGRVALPASWAGARKARTPVLLWASLWRHPRSAVHALSYLALRRLYRSADAVVTYGPHVSAYVRARGARNVHVAAQSVDNAFWSAPLGVEARAGAGGRLGPDPWSTDARVRFLFAGRGAPEKGIETLLEAWAMSGLGEPGTGGLPGGSEEGVCGLALVGVGANFGGGNLAGLVGPADPPANRHEGRGPGVRFTDAVSRERMREIYARADVLVAPSIATRTFREPWGLVINEAMNRGLAVICSDAVGAAAGGLVRDGQNGLVVSAGDSEGLARALRGLADDSGLRERLGGEGAKDVRAYSHEEWAEGFSRALATVGVSRGRW